MSRNNLRVISPQDINSNSEAVSTKRRSSSQEETSGPVKRPRCTSKESEGKPSTAEALQKFQKELGNAVKDPFKVVLRTSKLPLSLLDAKPMAGKEKVHILDTEPYRYLKESV